MVYVGETISKLTGGIRSSLYAAIVELRACSTAHQVSSLYVVRRRRSAIRADVVGRFLQHPSPRVVAVAQRPRRFRPRISVVIRWLLKFAFWSDSVSERYA